MKKIRKNLIGIILAFCFLIGNVVFLTSCFGGDQEFSINDNEVTLTLTSDFSQSGSLDSESGWTTGVTFKSSYAMIQVFRWKASTFGSYEELTLTDFGKIETRNGDLFYNDENKLCYTKEYSSSGNFSKRYYFKTEAGYYEFDVTYVASNDSRVETWMKSVAFSKDKIYDVDKTIGKTKQVLLDQNDNVTIDIGANYCRLADNENEYRRILLTGQIYYSDIEFFKEEKATSEFESLEEFADSFGLERSSSQGVNYIALDKNYIMIGYGACDGKVYCFESTNCYFYIEAVSNDASERENFETFMQSVHVN